MEAVSLAYTPTEREVLRLYALGMTWQQTMHELRIGRNTLGTHWTRIMDKTPEATCHIDVLRVIGWLKVDAA